jgi:hypothetical protein
MTNAIMLQDLMKSGVCRCGGGDALKDAACIYNVFETAPPKTLGFSPMF